MVLLVGCNEMNSFVLHPRLASDCFVLGELECSLVLLMNNALVPWFILVPRVDVIELCELEAGQQALLLDEINLLSRYIKDNFSVDKLNVAAIGNVVEQLHVHVIGRSRDDYCWPGVVWGREECEAYTDHERERIVSGLTLALGSRFRACD